VGCCGRHKRRQVPVPMVEGSHPLCHSLQSLDPVGVRVVGQDSDPVKWLPQLHCDCLDHLQACHSVRPSDLGAEIAGRPRARERATATLVRGAEDDGHPPRRYRPSAPVITPSDQAQP
jgi:hypothetical protein